MPYHSEFFGVDVRDEIAREFTDRDGRVDDMMAGLHEVRARLLESRSSALPSDAETAPAARSDDPGPT